MGGGWSRPSACCTMSATCHGLTHMRSGTMTYVYASAADWGGQGPRKRTCAVDATSLFTITKRDHESRKLPLIPRQSCHPPQGVELRRRRANPSVSCVFLNRRGRSRGPHRGEPCVKSMPCCVCNRGRNAASGRSPRVLASVDPRSPRMCVGHRPPVCRGPCPSPAMREP